MKILVTGGAGYIGSVTAALLMEDGHEVVVADDLSTGFRDGVPAGANFVHIDLLEREKVMELMKAGGFEAVMHFAAKIAVGESAEKPELYFRHNITSALNVVEAVHEAGVPRMIFSSTAATYGEPVVVPIEETAATVPTNAYGASKLAIDQLLTYATAAHGFSAVSLRYFNVAGAHGKLGERHDPETHLIPRLLLVAKNGGTFEVYGDDYPTPDGTCVRDYVHVEDLARAHLLALNANVVAPGKHEIFNLGSGEGFSVKQVLEAARQVTGAPIDTVFNPRRGGDSAQLVASSSKARNVLGWSPQKPQIWAIIKDAWEFMQARNGA